MKREMVAVVAVGIALMTGCSSNSRPDDAGTDAGADAGCAARSEAAISALLSQVCSDGGPSPAVIFRLRNASDADLWVATSRWIGFGCQPTTFFSTCSGYGLGAQTVQSELCLYPLRRLEPDASVDLEPYGLAAHIQIGACPPRAVGLPAGSYRVQFSYSLDAGAILQLTRPLAFSTPTDGGVVELSLP